MQCASRKEAGMKVMLVDHEKSVRDQDREVLRKLGYNDVVESADVQDALSKAFTANPDVIVIEHDMPGMTGIDFARTYRDRNGQAPILIMDARPDRNKVVAAGKAGVASYLLRPYTPDTFAQYILQALMKRKAA
jgi:DNA-binding NarL/FixJ family response regulator